MVELKVEVCLPYSSDPTRWFEEGREREKGEEVCWLAAWKQAGEYFLGASVECTDYIFLENIKLLSHSDRNYYTHMWVESTQRFLKQQLLKKFSP